MSRYILNVTNMHVVDLGRWILETNSKANKIVLSEYLDKITDLTFNATYLYCRIEPPSCRHNQMGTYLLPLARYNFSQVNFVNL